jgi:hypothetical protein
MRRPLAVTMGFTLLAAATALSLVRPDPNWDARSRTFSWRNGQVQLPYGFSYHHVRGTDSFEGVFISRDGKVAVRHDIGGMAGVWAHRERSFFFEESAVDGVRVLKSRESHSFANRETEIRTIVSFPDCERANFFLWSPNPEDLAVIDYVARSFRPRACFKPPPR